MTIKRAVVVKVNKGFRMAVRGTQIVDVQPGTARLEEDVYNSVRSNKGVIGKGTVVEGEFTTADFGNIPEEKTDDDKSPTETG